MLILLLRPRRVELEAVGSMDEKINKPAFKTDGSVLEFARTLPHEYVRERYMGRKGFHSNGDVALVTG